MVKDKDGKDYCYKLIERDTGADIKLPANYAGEIMKELVGGKDWVRKPPDFIGFHTDFALGKTVYAVVAKEDSLETEHYYAVPKTSSGGLWAHLPDANLIHCFIHIDASSNFEIRLEVYRKK